MNLKLLAIVIMFFVATPLKAQESQTAKTPPKAQKGQTSKIQPKAQEGQPSKTPPKAQEDQTSKTPKEKLSYSIGADAAKNFKRRQLDIDIEMVIKGLRDIYTGSTLMIPESEIQATLQAYQQELMQKMFKSLGEKNKKEGDAFLAENKTKEGVITLPSGLQYKILKAGDGKIPVEGETVEVNYKGTILNGTEFDSSYKRGQSSTFKLDQIIPGFKEALKLMPVGSKWQLYIPSELAYKDRGAGNTIEPNMTLIFEIELLAIKEPTAEGSKKEPPTN
jgi:FKBP-type peptidyl-prolyl cis-trans isomerase